MVVSPEAQVLFKRLFSGFGRIMNFSSRPNFSNLQAISFRFERPAKASKKKRCIHSSLSKFKWFRALAMARCSQMHESVKAAKSGFNWFYSILIARNFMFISFESVSNGWNKVLHRF